MSIRRRLLEDRHRPLYLISVASELLHVHPQTLRLYEREGLVSPSRTGGQRMYSQADLERLSLILELSRELGVNRAGVEIILRMRRRIEGLQSEFDRMLSHLDEEIRKEFEQKIRELLEEDNHGH